MWNIHRLRKTREFSSVISQGKKAINQNFLISCSHNKLDNCRFGISIPRKLVKKAVKRNYYKRQIRNMLIFFLKKFNCQFIHPLNSLTHYNLVIIIRINYLDVIKSYQSKQENLYKLISNFSSKEAKKMEKSGIVYA